MCKHTDIYAGQIGTNGVMECLVYDSDMKVWGKHRYSVYNPIGNRNIKSALKARKEKIAEWESEDKVVKGVRSIIPLFKDLFISRVEPEDVVIDINDLFDRLPVTKFFLLRFGPSLDAYMSAEEILSIPALRVSAWFDNSECKLMTLRAKGA